jgi:hypothetical protein
MTREKQPLRAMRIADTLVIAIGSVGNAFGTLLRQTTISFGGN